jgi:hypothetical protein
MNPLSIITEDVFAKVFNERNYNPPLDDAEFDEEFDSALEGLRKILMRHAKPEDFFLYESHNRARFLDVAFNSEGYLLKALVDDVQRWLRSMEQEWMVSLWEACFLLVTRDQILGFDPTQDDPAFAKLVALMNGPSSGQS